MPVIAEYRGDSAFVPGGDCLTEREVGGKYRCRLRELLAVLFQQAPEYTLADDEFLRDLILGDAFVGRAHQKKRNPLQYAQQQHEKNYDAGLKAA
jgi:hypothetical protein